MYFLKNLLLYFGAWSIQTECIVMMTNEGSTKIIKFMTPRAWVLVQGHGHISHTLKMYYYNPLKKGAYCFATVGRLVCRSVDQVLSAQYPLTPSLDQYQTNGAGVALNE